jgi:hypothetical protein
VTGDFVCVTTQRRTETWNDNAQVDARRQPGGGAYGFETCKPGYVWREAVANDKVCVTPDAREQARYDNSQAQQRAQR